MRNGPAAAASSPTPLVVDVDGTLLATDLLHESILQFIARHPFETARLFAWSTRGKAELKSRLADRLDPGIDTVPLREPVLALIREAQAAGQPVYLASASDRRYVERLAERVGGVSGVFGTEAGAANLAGAAKASRLVGHFGEGGYDYVGDRPVDFPIWRSARNVLVVAHSNGFAARVRKAFPDARIVARVKQTVSSHLSAMRPHQWAKNSLVFLPMIAGHRFEPATILASTIAFACFCLAASSAYIVNDLLDLPADRDHPRKSQRTFASGEASIAHGIGLAALLMASAVALSFAVPIKFTAILLLYVGSTLAYSLILKRKLLLDVVWLGGLYTLRVYGGLAANSLDQTQWLLAFCLFIFLSLAIVKRCSELVVKRSAGQAELVGRGYRVEDLTILLQLGAASGYGAVFVVTLYLSSPEVMALYRHPDWLWLMLPFLIYWISRVLVLANRGVLHDDPLVFALSDHNSWFVAMGVAAITAASI